jgi:hypothetical protein
MDARDAHIHIVLRATLKWPFMRAGQPLNQIDWVFNVDIMGNCGAHSGDLVK